MKKILSLIIIALVFAFSSNAQTFVNDNASNTTAEALSNSQANMLLVNQTQIAQQNNVFITQIGDSNVSNTKIKSQDSNVTVIQNGNDNSTFVNLNVNTIDQSILQNGNNNTVFDTSFLQSQVREATIVQNGDNQNLTIFGNNSLSDKIKVSMQGQSQSVIIRNFD